MRQQDLSPPTCEESALSSSSSEADHLYSSENGVPVEVEEESRPMMVHPAEVEAAKVQMMMARKALEEYEKLYGHASSTEHMRLVKAFANSAKLYLRVSLSKND